MAKLVLSFQGRVLEDFPLDKERVTIGRAADNDICIENLAVSGRHAAVETFQNDSYLVDLVDASKITTWSISKAKMVAPRRLTAYRLVCSRVN